jgi:hypothetical protein
MFDASKNAPQRSKKVNVVVVSYIKGKRKVKVVPVLN